MRLAHRLAVGHHVRLARQPPPQRPGHFGGPPRRRRLEHQPRQSFGLHGVAQRLEGHERLGVGKAGAAIEDADHRPVAAGEPQPEPRRETHRIDAGRAGQLQADDGPRRAGVFDGQGAAADECSVHRLAPADPKQGVA